MVVAAETEDEGLLTLPLEITVDEGVLVAGVEDVLLEVARIAPTPAITIITMITITATIRLTAAFFTMLTLKRKKEKSLILFASIFENESSFLLDEAAEKS